ncbi:hypothetical protein [Bacillus cereus]|uniref:hypothetical protein n=1 Tax=Bacillus cereus TaxID=1396 RepID=UPI0011A601A0|nr:hypothetical protein [Bacillus cereus]
MPKNPTFTDAWGDEFEIDLKGGHDVTGNDAPILESEMTVVLDMRTIDDMVNALLETKEYLINKEDSQND